MFCLKNLAASTGVCASAPSRLAVGALFSIKAAEIE
jgi:hypothetical protein